jgi:hypothetical protein
MDNFHQTILFPRLPPFSGRHRCRDGRMPRSSGRESPRTRGASGRGGAALRSAGQARVVGWGAGWLGFWVVHRPSAGSAELAEYGGGSRHATAVRRL